MNRGFWRKIRVLDPVSLKKIIKDIIAIYSYTEDIAPWIQCEKTARTVLDTNPYDNIRICYKIRNNKIYSKIIIEYKYNGRPYCLLDIHKKIFKTYSRDYSKNQYHGEEITTEYDISKSTICFKYVHQLIHAHRLIDSTESIYSKILKKSTIPCHIFNRILLYANKLKLAQDWIIR